MDHPLAEFGRTWFSVVTETEMASRPLRITEKPLKPLMNFHPFIVLGNPGSLALLREYGFQTFPAIFDEAYDEEPDPRRRFEMVFREVERLCHVDQAEFERLGRGVEDAVIFNARHALVDLPNAFKTHLDRELVSRLLAPAADDVNGGAAAPMSKLRMSAPGSLRPMNEIRVLGSVLTPEFQGGPGDAESLTNLVNSKGRLRKTDPEAEAEISWTFDSEGGTRGLYLRYASKSDLPGCRLLVNDATVMKAAAYESTLGLLDWRYQGAVNLPPGRNRISLRIHGAPPQIEGFAVAQPPSVSYPSVDEGLRRQKDLRRFEKGKRPFTVRPERLASLVEFVRRAASDEGEFNQVQRVIEQVVLATRWDAMDGQARLPWGGPLNGQSYRQLIFHRLMGTGVDAIVETGTHVGASTAFFARRGVPVFSCDVQEARLAAAIVQLSDCKNVTLHLEDSRAFLRGLAADPALAFSLPLFYLDAHWGDELPLADEVAIIRGRWPSFVIIIDDFQVPGASYTWGDYGEGRELTLGYLQRSGIDFGGLAVLFPSASADGETGVKRGSLVLTPAALYDEHLASERTLYRVHPKPA
jgi:predicted O-methyltransferase YrrM